MIKIQQIIVILVLELSCVLGVSAKRKTDKRPNVIVIMADDLGYETIGANGGSSYITPAINKLATNGVRFEHCYAQPLCTPSRVKIMTGIYNVRNYTGFGILEESQTTFGNLFKEAGYETCIVGKWQLGKDPESPQNFGFNKHCLWQVQGERADSTGNDTRYSKPTFQIDGELKTYSATDYGPRVTSEYGIDFIDKCHENKQPFLLYYPMLLTHCPFSPTPDSPEWIKDDTTIKTYKGQVHYFEDMAFTMDKIVGNITSKLKELGIEDNTLIIFTGDNGTDKPVKSILNGKVVAGAKGSTTDAGTRVPLIAQWVGKIPKGSVCNDLIDFSDFLPTICEAASIEVPASLNIDGRSFMPQLLGEECSPREWVYCWYSRSGRDKRAKVFARNHRYKLYQSGKFYDISKDTNEKNSIDSAEFDKEQKLVWQMLNKVLKQYENRRLESISAMSK